jgi:hypothetical protein
MAKPLKQSLFKMIIHVEMNFTCMNMHFTQFQRKIFHIQQIFMLLVNHDSYQMKI